MGSEPKVQGYTRPGSAQSSTSQHAGAKQINLLEGLSQQDAQMLQQRFDQAASLLHAGQFEYAITALDQVIKIQPGSLCEYGLCLSGIRTIPDCRDCLFQGNRFETQSGECLLWSGGSA